MVETKLSYNPDFVVHPGETLKDELEYLKLTQVELAQRTGLSEKHISQVINGVDPITSDTAIKLELAIGIPATFWSNLQKNYELNVARIASDKRIAEEIEGAKKFTCYNELVKLGCVEKTNDWKLRTENLLKFFGVNSLAYIQNTEAIAFRQATGAFDQLSLATWLRCGELEAKKLKLNTFDKNAVKNIVPQLRKLTTHPEGFSNKLQELCASVGIAVVFTPYFKKTKVNGSARWINNKATIQLNTRGAYSDIFWFTLFHEIGHIILHGAKDKFIDYQGIVRDEKEKDADNFAAESLISHNDYEAFLKDLPLNKSKIEAFARKVGVSPDIVLGRLAHENKLPWKIIAHREKLTVENN